MGGVRKRLGRLEEHSRRRAVIKLRRAWADLTNKELTLLLGPYTGASRLPDGRICGIREPTPEESEADERFRALATEELIAAAIGLTEQMEPEEVDRRISALNRELGIFERGEGIRRQMQGPQRGGEK